MVDFTAALSQQDFTTLPAVNPGPLDLAPIKAGLSKYDAEIAEMLAEAAALVVTEATVGLATELGTRAAKTIKAIEKAQKEATGPAWEFKSSVDRLAKTYKEDFEAIKTLCAGKISAFTRAQSLARAKVEEASRKAQAEIQAKLDAEVAAENAKRKAEAAATGQDIPEVAPIVLAPVAIPEAPKVTRTESGSSYQATAWVFKVVDPAKVPREYLVVDESAIRRAVKDGIRTVPGVKIYEDTQTRFR